MPRVVPATKARMPIGIVIAAIIATAPDIGRAEQLPDSLVAVSANAFPAAAASSGSAALASTDSAATSTDSAQVLRGTEQPIPRRESVVRYAGRGLLYVPYAVIRVVTWPIVWVAEAEDRAHVITRAFDFLKFGYGRGAFRSTLLFGYESDIGLSLVGLDATVVDWPESDAKLRLSGSYVSVDDNLAAFLFRSAPHFLQWESLARFENRSQRRFYGLGPDSDDTPFKADRQRLLFEGTAALRPGHGFKVAVTGYARRDELRTPDQRASQSVAAGFPGFFAVAKESDYEGAEAELSWDTRDNENFSSRGSLLRVFAGANHASSDGDEDYRHWHGELQTYVNLWRGNRTLVLRALAEGVTADHPERIPYTELVRIGGSKGGLRGYPSGRFVDQNGLVLTAEYHYPVTTRMVGKLFADFGTVASEFEKLQLSDVGPSVGMGLAYIVGDHAFVAHVARSEEGIEFYVGTDVAFDSRSRRLR